MSFLEFVPKTSSRRLAALFAATLLATTCAASAGTLTYTLGTITGTGMTFETPITGFGMAGLMHLSTADGIVDAWCVDLPDNFITTGGTYTIGSSAVSTGSPGVPADLTSDQIGEMGALAKFGTPLVYHPGAYTSEEVAAAIQIAMWDIEYEATFTYDALGSPIDAAPPAPSGLVAQYMADVGPGAPWGEYFGFKVLYTDATPNNQTLITIVPEPSTWAMMLLGFAGLGFAGYRRVKAKPAFAQA
jgi:PEP-CTERM motif